MNNLKRRFQIPESVRGLTAETPDLGPEFEWRGPEELELQGWFRPEPDFHDVGFLKGVAARSASVCRIENANGEWRGTGFLIAPRMLLTNYHVLQQYGGPDLDENARDIVLRFGCFSVKEGVEESLTFKLTPEKPILKASDSKKLDYVLLHVEERISTAGGIKPAPYELRAPDRKGWIKHPPTPQGADHEGCDQ